MSETSKTVSPKSVRAGELSIGAGAPIALIAGPCQLETLDHALMIASKMAEICDKLEIGYIFKGSFDKANRSSGSSQRGLGMVAGLDILAEVKSRLKIPTLTDIHEEGQCAAAAMAVDVLQIPAFLCRQTDLLLAAGRTGRAINVKKGQFLAPWDMKHVADKIASTGNESVLLCERGATFGYNNLVTDFRSLPIMAQTGWPVVFDATHSVQQPGGLGGASGGQREFAPVLARAACAVGVAALFIETHQDPDNAPSDGPNMIPLDQMDDLVKQLKAFDDLAKGAYRETAQPAPAKPPVVSVPEKTPVSDNARTTSMTTMPKPLTTVSQNTWEEMSVPMITPTGFREYDARWRFPEQINLMGFQAVGLGLATQLHEMGVEPKVAVGNDYRSYSPAIKNALILGLMAGGATVKDIGPALSPMAYFAQFHLDCPAVAMVTASHNPNGWAGVKLGADRPLTHGPDEMGRLRDIVMNAQFVERPGGSYEYVDGVREAYIQDIVGDFKLSRPLKVVCATGNGTASVFAPEILRRIGAEVVDSYNTLDYDFPNYNPNPEALKMLHHMADSVRASGADLALGFDGDGDRCGVVDNEGEEIFADKVGVIMARDLIKLYPNSTFVADVKSTGLFASDPALLEGGAKADYWKTGHSYMKRRVKEIGALAGFEKSGHYFLAGEVGRGYDCGMRVAFEICKMLDRNPTQSMADLRRALPKTYSTPTMSPFCPDEEKYPVIERLQKKLVERHQAGVEMGGLKIEDVITVNGARVILEGGAWALVRASSNEPKLVVVCESARSDEEMRAIFASLDEVIRTEPSVGEYDQKI